MVGRYLLVVFVPLQGRSVPLLCDIVFIENETLLDLIPLRELCPEVDLNILGRCSYFKLRADGVSKRNAEGKNLVLDFPHEFSGCVQVAALGLAYAIGQVVDQ